MKILQLLLITLTFFCCVNLVTSQRPEFIQSPQNQSVCEGRTVKFTCVVMFPSGSVITSINWATNDGLQDATSLPNHTADDNGNEVTPPADVTSVLTLSNVSINRNRADYTCTQGVLNPIISNLSFLTVLVPPMTAPTVTVTPLSSTSFNVSWTTTDPDHNYIITWTNLRTGMIDNMTVSENTNSYTVTGLSGIDNYNVTVTANNSCGMMISDPITVYGPPSSAPTNIKIPDSDITSESFTVQWDALNYIFPFNYTVRWYRGNDLIGMVSVDGLSYTVTGLTANTSYNVTVTAVSTCCGEGLESNDTNVTTNMRPPTEPPPQTITVLSSTPTPTPALQNCTITSPSVNTIRVSCELVEIINVTISSNSCSCSQPITMIDSNPITVFDLAIGVYTVEVTAVNSNDLSIGNNRIVEMITICEKSTATDESDSSSFSTEATIAVACVVTLLVSVTVTAIVSFLITHKLTKTKYESTTSRDADKVLYEQVHSPSASIARNDPKCQKNPSYDVIDVGGQVVMDTNPAYETYKL